MIGTDDWVAFTIPVPISTNARNRNVGAKERAVALARGQKLPGRVNTAAYKAWLREAGWSIKTQFIGPLPRCNGDVWCIMDVPEPLDTDNIKAVPDLLQRLGMIANDRLVYQYTLRRVPAGDPCIVRLRPADGQCWAEQPTARR